MVCHCYHRATFRLGLESDHAYSILDARQVNSQRLVRLRNPWGEKEVKGENWSKWPKNLKNKFLPSAGNDGVFWMRRLRHFALEEN